MKKGTRRKVLQRQYTECRVVYLDVGVVSKKLSLSSFETPKECLASLNRATTQTVFKRPNNKKIRNRARKAVKPDRIETKPTRPEMDETVKFRTDDRPLYGQLEIWRHTHWDGEKGWISTDIAALYENMMNLSNQHFVESMSDE